MRGASESTSELKGKETCSFDGFFFFYILTYRQTRGFSLHKGVSSIRGNGEMPDSGPLHIWWCLLKPTGRLHMASLRNSGSLRLQYRIITTLWS